MGAGAVRSRAVGQGGDAQASRGALSNEERIRFGVTAGPSLMGVAAVAAEVVEDEAGVLAEAFVEAATAEAAAGAAGVSCEP